MKLANASVNGLFGMYDHSIEMDAEGLTFIHSTNGMGKTVFLKLIQRLLTGRIDYLERIPFGSMELGFDDGSRISVSKDGGLRIVRKRDGTEEELGPEKLRGIMESIYISPERLTVKTGDGGLTYAIDTYAEELRRRFSSVRRETAIDLAKAEPDDDISNEDLEDGLFDLEGRLRLLAEVGLEVDPPDGYSLTPEPEDVERDRGGYLRLLSEVRRITGGCYRFAESLKAFQQVVNCFYTSKRMTVTDGIISVSMLNGNQVPLEVLSSGEKHILIIFYRILFHANPGSLIIIDEPEISIHVSWQQKMGHLLLDLCELRDLQMLVATHSPQIIHDLWDRANELGGGIA